MFHLFSRRSYTTVNESNTKNGALIGGVVGGIVGLIFIVAIIRLCVRSCNREKERVGARIAVPVQNQGNDKHPLKLICFQFV